MKRSVAIAAALAAWLAFSASTTIAQTNDHPPAMMRGGPPTVGGPGYYSDEFAAEGFDAFGPAGCDSGCCDYGGDPCDYGGYGCCDDCGYGGQSGYGDWWDCLGLGQRSRWFFNADYLFVRANFSEAVAYLEQNILLPDPSDTFHEFNFQHESSYRFGGGYKLGCCDEEVRFEFTRMSSNAATVAPQSSQDTFIFVPYETTSPDSPTFLDADVDTKSWDLEYRKTIPLGGAQPCGCGDACGEACGCGDACGCAPACPAWDITWSGGVRFADVNWNRHAIAFDDEGDTFRTSSSELNFEGGGPRVGLEGRRYFGQRGWYSMYLKGDISLLLGQMQHQATRLDEEDIFTTQTARGRRIIPVTEIEAGLTANVTSNSLVSAGYLFSGWHDLGMRDQFNFVTQLEDLYDDANILGFDGFFARLEIGY